MELGLGLSGENHSAKTNVTTEPIAAPPALCIRFQNSNRIHNPPIADTVSVIDYKKRPDH
ncbi:hypothetical protein EFP34_02290 [Lacticaseibacillus paracasei]|nr:hypothetical protein [Lacticaseibacillus paracasei]